MKWVALCLRNKLIIYVLSFALCLAGLFALSSRPLSPFPQIKTNAFNVFITYPGANAQLVEKQITSAVISRFQSLDNIQYISAQSQAGYAYITLIFNDMTDNELLQAQVNISQAINSAHLPNSVPQPQVILQAGTSGLVDFIVTSKQVSLFDLDNFILATLVPKFSTLPGVQVGSDSLSPVVKIKLKPELLAQYQLNPSDIGNTINQNYQSAPLGSLLIEQQNYFLNTTDNYNTFSELQNLVVGYQNSGAAPIYLKNIASIAFERRNNAEMPYTNLNGQTAADVWLYTKTNSNPFLISSTSTAYVNSLKNTLPADLKITSMFDISNIMLTSFEEVALTILSASLLVLLVALVFLGRLKTTIIPIITIPVCLLGAAIFISLCGVTINLLMLLAMVIAVGLVVDDAIVVVENITRSIEQGLSKYDAVLEGTSSIAPTIIGITLTLLAVYMPMVFSGGIVAQLLRPFAFTLASAVFISGIVALTLTPVMALALMDDHQPNRYQIWFERVLHQIIDQYQKILHFVFKKPLFSLSVVILLVAIGGYYALRLPQMIFPSDPEGSIRITIDATPSDSIASLTQKIAQFSSFYQDAKVKNYLLESNRDNTGALSMRAQIQYKEKYLRQTPLFTDQINQFIKDHNIKNSYATVSDFMNWGDDSHDISFYLYGATDIDGINAAAQTLTDLLTKSPIFSLATNTINIPQKQLAFDLDTLKAARLGITRIQILQLLSAAYSGIQMDNDFSIAGLSVPIVMKLDNAELTDPNSFQKLMIQSPRNHKFYPLGDFVTIKTIAKPLAVTTLNNQPAVKIETKLNKGYDMASSIDWINQTLQIAAPHLQIQYVDKALSFIQSNNESLYIALLGVICVYFLLSLLFKSMVDPFIIMLTVPFTVIGGALSLYLIGGSLNIFSTLGLITLVGLITKHGVLIVQFANAELTKGGTVLDAILLATRYRFRPIIMTTLAMIFGALPLILSDKIMYVSRENLAIVIIGGLTIGTIFSLVIVPLVYFLIKRPITK
ncbi:MAG: efflux RND transporter permease subunit [Gammaproteobacteria bacterium]|nr:efflux RND transporter permease subunit [Gammaproteobacteria bacterium]